MLIRSNKCTKAVYFWTAFCVFSAGVFVQAKSQSVEESLAKAQGLLVSRQRREALKELTQSKDLIGLKPAAKKEITEAIREAAVRFLTDKGQRSFELGQSQIPLQAANSLKHLREAQKLEDGNYQVELAVARVHIVRDDCAAAKVLLGQLDPEVALATEIVELQLITAWCLEDDVQAESLIRKKPVDAKIATGLVRTNQAWLKWRQKDPEKALGLAKEAISLDAQNPATLYWFWRIQKENDLNASAVAQAFVKRCQGREVDIRRRSFSMVEFCLRLPEVEAYLKGQGADSQDGNS
jgi:hypothetical protein